VWVGKNASGSVKINHSEIAFISAGKKHLPQQLPLVEINDGIHVTMKESNSLLSAYWLIFSNVAPIDPGVYSMTLWIKSRS
jgi:hypothetical protein